MDVEISVVNTDNCELLRRCLATLPQACEGLAWRATVVDNASRDGSANMIGQQFPQVRLIRGLTRQGFSANHNRVLHAACDEASARYGLILNEDTELHPRAVTTLVHHADANPRLGAVGPQLRDETGAREPSCFSCPTPLTEVHRAFRPGSHPRGASDARWVNAACLLVRVAALREVGLLDERFFIFYEDTDLGLRLSHRGWSCEVVDGAVVLHRGHRAVASEPLRISMERQMVRSRFLYLEKHYGRTRARGVALLVRTTLMMRAAKAAALATAARERALAEKARLLLALATYDPRRPLDHEIRADRSPFRALGPPPTQAGGVPSSRA